MNKKFSNDFTYMPKTYVKINTNEFEKEFENYTLSENNLWLIKPKLLSRGRGIHFLKNVENIKKNDIVMKYISNPLLIDNRKFDIRLYLLVTGHDPLKIYLFKEGLCRLSTDEFDLNIKDLDNTYKHLTNTSINKNNKKGYKYNDFVKSISELKKLIEEKYNTNFNKIWDQIKDICIKTLISMNNIQLKKNNNSKLSSNNLFKILGVDVIIDDKFKVWLLEVNHGPDLNVSKYKSHRTNIKYQIVHDMFNIIGMVPFSHVNGHALEGKCIYENSIEEIIDQSICELTRPLGGFEVIFPLKENINYYKKFFESYSENNKVLWNRINKENGKKKKKL
ncbi:TTL-domain-containing protein [Piromyces finnis]|uniref:TTL-domain-containing protein n=1 Tax=Piromyces finnis TaxID=1754191 RepID=A0A1Y1UGK4_9FUNG|nr:TTL-domain-containing protein [Piromyces finnis]|eukprot:ORX36195.1 TTL-domain-containing protein [Piromyces finnis]